eukprot:TRINITY_DN7133_c0_g2_i1.p1 TRINITY_DN7133_c0_g2~~TRINITY_DN7133_c0_g2_i1.p1  ORF type:complete len:889 (-),score=127.43 TRINITY_DN7133_c0_g2_i1:41-2707(-)
MTSRHATSKPSAPVGKPSRTISPKDSKTKGPGAAHVMDMLTKAQARHEALQMGLTDQLYKRISQEVLREFVTVWYESCIWIRSAINSLEGAADMMFTRHTQRLLRFALAAWRSAYAQALSEAYNGERKQKQLDLGRRTSARLWMLKSTGGLSLCATAFLAMVRCREAFVHERQLAAQLCNLETRHDKFKTWLEGHFRKSKETGQHGTLCLALQAWHHYCDLSKRDVVVKSKDFQVKQKLAVALKKACWRQLLPRIFGTWLVACNWSRCRSLQQKHGRLLEQLDSLLENADTLHSVKAVLTVTTFNAWAHHGDVLKRRIKNPFPGSLSRMSFWESLLSKMSRDDDFIRAQAIFQVWVRVFSDDQQQRAQQAVQQFKKQTMEAKREVQEQTAHTQRLETLLGECMRARRAEAAASASAPASAAGESPLYMRPTDDMCSTEPSLATSSRSQSLREAFFGGAPVSRTPTSLAADAVREDNGFAPSPTSPQPQEDQGFAAVPMSTEMPSLDSRGTREGRRFSSATTLQEGSALDSTRTRTDQGFHPASKSLEVASSDSTGPRTDRSFNPAPRSPEVSPSGSTRPRTGRGFDPAPRSPEVSPSGSTRPRTDRGFDPAPRSPEVPPSDSRRPREEGGRTASANASDAVIAHPAMLSRASRTPSRSSRTPPPKSTLLTSVCPPASPTSPLPMCDWPQLSISPSGSSQALASPCHASAMRSVSPPSTGSTPPSPSRSSMYRLVPTEGSAASCAGQLCFTSPFGASIQATAATRGPFAAPAASPPARSSGKPRSRVSAGGGGGSGGGNGGGSSGRSARMDSKDGGSSSTPNLAAKPAATKRASMREGDRGQATRTSPPQTSDGVAAARIAEAARRLAPAARRPAAPAAGSLVVSRLRS